MCNTHDNLHIQTIPTISISNKYWPNCLFSLARSTSMNFSCFEFSITYSYHSQCHCFFYHQTNDEFNVNKNISSCIDEESDYLWLTCSLHYSNLNPVFENLFTIWLQVIHLKHVLQLVGPLKSSLEGSSDTLLKAFYQVWFR